MSVETLEPTESETHAIVEGLNREQAQAVQLPLGHALVLAGAGSGKTRVLIHRMAWLMTQHQASPYQLFAVTFTNKAANEMRNRLSQFVTMPAQQLWVGTFHGLAHRLLRRHAELLGLPKTFQIMDTDDGLRMLKRLYKALNLDDKQWPVKQAQWFIHQKKDEGLRASAVKAHDVFSETMLTVYKAYEEACQTGGLIDFSDLLLYAYELFRDCPSVAEQYRDQFRHLLVDEFQDTNTIQYAWLKLLMGPNTDFMAVGDDDQSIYGWRGAKIENIYKLSKDFPKMHMIRLEQNYRSTKAILDISNALIKENSSRMGKTLWTEQPEGDPVLLYNAFNEIDEARFVVGKVQGWIDGGGALDEVAVLYRSNAQSRILEEALLQKRIPYRVFGGTRFFDRMEIKDALAYLRLIANRGDDAAFERVVNLPARSIGEKTLLILRQAARDEGRSLWDALTHLLAGDTLPPRARGALAGFLSLVDQLDEKTKGMPLHEQTEFVIRHSGLIGHYQKERGEKAQARLENLSELVTATRQFDVVDPDETVTPLVSFLTHAALEAGEMQVDEHQSGVQLMTLHAAKGLEFPLVFMTGLEEGMFPSQRSAEDLGRLEEERRLCYVGMTRAMKQLVLTHADTRRVHGREMYHRRSRFLQEVPSTCFEEIRLKSVVRKPQNQTFSPRARAPKKSEPVRRTSLTQAHSEQAPYPMGARVYHQKFGNGTVMNYEGQGQAARVQVNFDRFGMKWLACQYTSLEIV